MSELLSISIIVPVYNSERNLQNCIDSLLNQDFERPFEIIMVDDASTDNSQNVIKKQNSPLIKLISLKSNKGPATARNEGLKIAKGEYIFFLDSDDEISKNSFKILYSAAKKNNLDLVISDKKVIDKLKNLRENTYIYENDIIFNNNEITKEIKKRLFNPLYEEGLIGITGRLIKRSIIEKNNISFQEGLRYLEDEIFSWDILSFSKKAQYIRNQLYSYKVYPNESTGISQGISQGFSILNFKTGKEHVLNCFKLRGVSIKESKKLADQAHIFFVISALVSYSRSIILKKVNLKDGKSIRKKLISNILNDSEVLRSIKNYTYSRDECKWIPKAIKWRFNKLLEFMSHRRAKEILLIRKKNNDINLKKY